MNQYNRTLAAFAAKIVALHDQRKALENDIALIYKEARRQGIRRNDLKAAVQNYHAAVSGGIPEAKPEANKADDDDMERHLAIIDRTLARVRNGLN
jgi:hypothetical protein